MANTVSKINAYSPLMNGFPYKELKEMYEENQHLIEDDQTFEEIILNTVFLGFKEDDKVLGAIYFYKKDGKTFVNVYAGRGTKESNFKCFLWALNGFTEDIYAISHQKTAIYGLLRAGFKKIGEDLYKYSYRR